MEKYEEYKEKALLNMSGTRLDRQKLASCTCGTLIEIQPLEGFNGAKISKYANEIFALHVGLNVIKVYMIRDLDIQSEEMNSLVGYMKENFMLYLVHITDANIKDQNVFIMILWHIQKYFII